MNKISAIILTYNEEFNIAQAIESCSFADEILVVDSFSDDKTLEIAKQNSKVKILQNEFISHAAQKNWAIPQAQHEWIFVLDADERTSKELIKEIKETLQDSKDSAYSIRRYNFFMDKKLNFVWKGDSVIRLFKKSECRYENKKVHEEIVTEGTIGKLQHKIKHDTYGGKGFSHCLRKSDYYSTCSAYDRLEKGKKATLYHIFIKPIFTFIKYYIVNRGFLDGSVGFIISTLESWTVFVRSVKMYRIQKGEKFPVKF